MTGQKYSKDNCSRRDASITTTEEPHGVDGAVQVVMLHLNPEHHPGRCRPYRCELLCFFSRISEQLLNTY